MSYGTILLSVPAFDDGDLIYDEEETRAIFEFFYPDAPFTAKFATMPIDNTARAYAQTMLVAAIDGSYGMSYVDGLFKALAKIISKGKKPSITGLCKKLAKKFIKIWWHHVKEEAQLEKPKIYDTVRKAVAFQLSTQVQMLINNPDLASNRLSNGFRAYVTA